jgi:hypothetical protein
MKRTEAIQQLIANGAYEEGDKDFLAALTDEQFAKVEKASTKTNEEVKEEVKEEEKKVEITKKVEEDVKGNKAVTVEEYLAAAPEGIRNVLSHGIKAHSDKCEELVKRITANKNNTFSPDYLKTLPLEALEAMAKLAGTPNVNFSMGAEAPVVNGETEGLAMPKVVVSE